MNGAAEFDSTKKQLHQLLKDIAEGKIQLPDFQRGWVSLASPRGSSVQIVSKRPWGCIAARL